MRYIYLFQNEFALFALGICALLLGYWINKNPEIVRIANFPFGSRASKLKFGERERAQEFFVKIGVICLLIAVYYTGREIWDLFEP